MRVSIKHTDKSSGLIFKTHQVEVAVTVVFSDEELAIIKSRKLKDYVVLQREPDRLRRERLGETAMAHNPRMFDLYVRDLVAGRPEQFFCDTPVDAKVYEQNLTEALKTLKSFLQGNAETAGAKVFEI
jgi:hypothetical protein